MSVDGLDLRPLGGRVNLREEVTEVIRASIVTGKMRPGQLYSAAKLADQFGVSATPVREALLDLVTEGHFEVVRNKGYRVRHLSAEELDEIAEVRLILEPPGMAAVAREAAADDAVAARIGELMPLAERIVTLARDGDLLEYTLADLEFHSSFLALHGNGQLVDIVRGMRMRSRLFGLEGMHDSGALATLAQEHVDMVEAGMAGDADRLERLTATHIGHVRSEWAGDAGGA